MVKVVKPDKKKLQENVESQLKYLDTKPDWVDYESLARSYVYLGEYSKYFDAMEKKLKEQERQIKMAKEKMGPYVIATELHKKANFLRLLFREEESRCFFEEALDNYKKALPDKFNNDADRFRSEIYGISDVEFHLGNYDNAIDICKYYRGEKPVSEMISRAILDGNNSEILEDAIELCKKGSRGVPIGMDNGCATSLWDFYEICLQLLGLPSVLDEVEKYIKSINS